MTLCDVEKQKIPLFESEGTLVFVLHTRYQN